MAAILLSLSWQSFVAQTHQHLNSGAVSAVAPAKAGVTLQQPGKPSPSDLPANCPICREIAHVGAYLLPAPAAFAAPAPALVWLEVTTPLGISLTQRSHAWQSRAPPYSLQA